MKPVWAIARLTFREGVRMRVFLVLLIVLLFIVLRLPFALKGDETLAGRLQTFLSYSLGAVGFFLSLATIFLSCATLTNEYRTRTLHLLVTKPVTRVQILVGKWLGVCLLNLLILIFAGGAIYGFAVFIKNRPETFVRDAVTIRDAIWTARTAAFPDRPNFEALARQRVEEEKRDQARQFPAGEEAAVREYTTELHNEWLRLRPGTERLFDFSGLAAPEREDTAFQVRFRLRAAPGPLDEMAPLYWIFIDPNTRAPLHNAYKEMKQRINEMHQFLFMAKGALRDGRVSLVIGVPPIPDRRYVFFFERLEDLEILYRVGGFEANYAKSLALIFFRLAFLSALALFFSTFVSFPVACFCVLTIFAMCIGIPWWLEAIGANLELRTDEVDPYGRWGPYIRPGLVLLLKGGFPDFIRYSGVGALIEGRYIAPSLLVQAGAHTLVYGLFLLIVPGWLVFRAREPAEVQV